MTTNARQNNENETNNPPQRLVLKFKEYIDISGLNERLAHSYPGTIIVPWLDPEELENLSYHISKAVALNPSFTPPKFHTYYILIIPPAFKAREIIAFLQNWDQDVGTGGSYDPDGATSLLESVYVEPEPALPPALTPNDEPAIGKQGYVEPYNPNNNTFGIDARYAWDNFGDSGGDGDGVKFIDLEHGWYLNHNDLPNNPPITIVHGSKIEEIMDNDWLNQGQRKGQLRAHGTKNLGIVIAPDNESNIMGLAPNAETKLISSWKIKTHPAVTGSNFEYDIGKAILAALNHLNPGDVLLIEEQLATTEKGKHDPVELDDRIFDMITLATQNGIIVIEPAGNGGNTMNGDPANGAYNLDQRNGRGTNSSLKILDRNSGDFKDSLAIMVAAATPETPHNCIKTNSPINCLANPVPSNFGSRIDCFAWGQCVFTIGAENGDATMTTDNYNGTSSASAIIAGAAILIQAIAKKKNGQPLTPTEMRDYLSDKNLNTLSEDSNIIGVMPNLRNIIQHYFEGDSG